MTIDVTFHGLCAFARQGKRYDALLLPENGVHKPILTIPVVQFRIKDSLAPLTVGHDQAGNQIAMWDLTGIKIKIGTGTSDPTFANANTGFALGLYHPAAKPRSAAELEKAVEGKGCKIELTSGSIAFDQSRPLNLIVSKDNKPIIAGLYPAGITWRGDADTDVVLVKGLQELGKIVLKDDGEHDIAFRVTNVARTDFDEGLGHFAYYYDLIELGNDKQLELKNNEADIDVFDCVPPVALPEA